MDKIAEFFSSGVDQIQVLADFDGTLTTEFVDGKKWNSLMSVLRDTPGYLTEGYQNESRRLYAQYYPLENDDSLPLEYRKAMMLEWWKKAYALLIEHRLRRRDVLSVVKSGIIQLRGGAKEFLEIMDSVKVPVVVMSASGLGEAVPMYCKEVMPDYNNFSFAVNSFEWSKDGLMVGYKNPILHSLNKDETTLQDFPKIYKRIRDRVKVLLLGNSLGDAAMAEGFGYKEKLSIGFVDKEEQGWGKKQDKLAEYFDLVVTSGEFTEINKKIRIALGSRS